PERGRGEPGAGRRWRDQVGSSRARRIRGRAWRRWQLPPGEPSWLGPHLLLQTDAGDYRWVAATIDANSAAGYELATGEAVMAIGGFNGSDPAPTLAQFQAYV